MVRLVLTTTLAAALAACYSPKYADCTNTCNASHLCPDGLSCSDGFCRAEGATGLCVDAGSTADSTPTECPANPEPTTGCMPIGQGPDPMKGCITACAATAATVALMYQTQNWHVLIIDNPMEEGYAEQVASQPQLNGAAWIGLSQQSGQTSPSTGWQWPMNMPPNPTFHWTGVPTQQPDDSDGTENDQQNCAVIGNGGWSDETCTALHPFLVEPNPNP